MLKIMEDYEQKIANYQQKEESVHVLVRESKQKVEETLLERDRVNLKEQQYVKTIERLQESLKSELAAQKSKYESLLDSLKTKNKSIVSHRDDEISEIQQKFHSTQMSYERALREVSSLQKDLVKAEELLEEEQKRASSRLDAYEKRFRELEESRINEKRSIETQSSSINFERAEWDRLRKNFETLISSSNRENESLKSTLKRIKDEYKRMEVQLEDMQRERENFIQEINGMKEEMYYKVEEVKESLGNKVMGLEKQLQDARERQRESEEKAFELFRQQEKVSEKWKEEHLSTVGYFEKVIQDQNYEIRRLVKRNKDLGDSFPIREISV
jgi:chromosome segregation ATPase